MPLESLEEMAWFPAVSEVDQKSSEATLPSLGLGGVFSPPPSLFGWPGNLANDIAFLWLLWILMRRLSLLATLAFFLEQLQVSGLFKSQSHTSVPNSHLTSPYLIMEET